MCVKKGLKDESNKPEFSRRHQIYVNDSLCPYYRGLWNEYKKLWNNKKLSSYFTVNGTVIIKQVENGPYKHNAHVNDLRALFPKEKISMCRVILGIYKLLSSFLHWVHLFFLLFVFRIWQFSDSTPFFTLFLIMFIICLIVLFIYLASFFCCVEVFPWCSDSHVC